MFFVYKKNPKIENPNDKRDKIKINISIHLEEYPLQ